ncbi:MAG TPA: two-component sensor histidine kinase, partial [Fibrobacteres bacterium]|nr:two-component sensor histidine kinase [Fibrobacterota bacterium]
MVSQTDKSSVPFDLTRGRLKIFLGMCAGVGKTYAMLKEARQRLTEGSDVVIGYAETHHRPETEALLQGLPIVPRKTIGYRGVMLEEMDLDAILARRPMLAIVDELPHTNAIGSRHSKRYQDILELLDAGIDVFTALNVQHIESRVDVVAGIASINVRETVPDSIIDMADDIQLIDITPEDLRTRLSEGKVYLGSRAATAADNFFRIANLSALREIAMRLMSEKVGRDVRLKMAERHIQGPWKSSERYMVAVGPSPFSEPLIRWTRRIASATQAPWIAVHVDTFSPLSDEQKQRLSRNLSLVKQLGGETVTVSAEDVSSALLQVAREMNVTQIVVGKPLESSLIRFFTGRSLVDKLILKSGDIDVCVVRAEKGSPKKTRWRLTAQRSMPWHHKLGFGCGIIAAITLLFWAIRGMATYSSIALLYLLAIVFLAMRLSRRAIVIIAALSGILLNFLFIPPILTFRISKLNDILMFSMYFVVALAIGQLTARLRMRELTERRREKRTGVLYKLAQCVVESHTLDEGIRLAIAQIDSVFEGRTAVTLVSKNGAIADNPHPASTWQLNIKESSVVAWVYGAGKPAGRFTDTLPQSEGIHVPLQTTHGSIGVLSLLITSNSILDVGQRELLETVADHVAALVDRYNLISQSNESALAQESEKLYKVLFDCLSHELKTPLTIVTTATSQAVDCYDKGDAAGGRFALHESSIALNRLRRIVDNLLSMTRLDSEQGKLEPVWCDIEEIITVVRDQLSDILSDYRVNVMIQDNIPMLQVDSVLLTHVILNLLVNASQYSPTGSEIVIAASADDKNVVVKVSDHGEGIPHEELNGGLFEKFHRGHNARLGCMGLGLSIVHRFMEIIGGTVTASNNENGN